MNRWTSVAAFGLLAACASYEPAPLEPERSDAEFRARTLADPGLREFVAANSTSAFPPAAFDLTTLTLVAFFFHPDLDVARARIAVAEAESVTAGAVPNPEVHVTPEYGTNPGSGVSPWILGFGFDLPIETADKRGLRVAQAQKAADAVRFELAQTAWEIRRRLRAALAESLLDARELELLRAEVSARTDSAALVERRLEAGEVSRPDVDAAQIELYETRLAAKAAEGRVAESRTSLAAALGIPTSALDGAAFAWPELDAPPDIDAATLQSAGLLNRIDVRRALAEYAASEAGLELEVAKQYPDVHLGPGYQWDQGQNKFSLGFSIQLPIFNQNEGPIAEADARRKEQAAKFLALQARIIGETDRAVARYRAALAELAEAQKSFALQEARVKSIQRAVEAGESDRLALAGAKVLSAVAARARFDAIRKAQTALGDLEDAAQRPLDSTPPPPELDGGPK